MDQSDLQRISIEQLIRFEYRFCGLTFGALALSFQFSPQMGHLCPWFLIGSWMLLLLSGLCGGWRVMKLPIVYRINAGQIIVKNWVSTRKQQMADPNFAGGIRAGTVLSSDTGKPLSPDEMSSDLKKEEKNLAGIDSQFDQLQEKLGVVRWAQIILFVLGLLANGIFVSLNLLDKSGKLM